MTDGLDQILDGYSELWTIGTGTSGRVVAALHKATGRRIALKFFSHDQPSDPAVARHFRAQVRLWQEVDCAQVVHLYEYIEADGVCVAVLELVDGPSLAGLLQREGPIPATAALAALDDILAGLAAAHELGLLHGNLKPENVLIDRDGHARITHFAISAPDNGPYLASEQRHASPASIADDLHAAAAVFSRCLTGAEPHADEPTAQAEDESQEPGPLFSVIQHGLANNPAKRPRSASEFRAELGAAAASIYGAAWKNDGTGMLRAAARELPAAGPVLGTSPASAFKRRLSVAALVTAAVALLVLTTLLLPHGRSPTHLARVYTGSASVFAAPGELYGVSCSALTACTAVGSTYRGVTATGTQTLAEEWNGANWMILPTPDPPGLVGAEFHGVSCTSPSACIAVGSSGFGMLLAEKWDGTKWTILPTPDPPDRTGSQFYAVSCTSPSACIAVGGSIGGPPLAESWDGTNWAVQSTPEPPGLISSTFYGVSCTSPAACTAVGNTNQEPMAERWNGASWTIQHMPALSPLLAAMAIGFGSVSCTSPAECTAVGPDDTFPYGLTADRWNGVQWATTPALLPADDVYSTLYGVSCTSPTACTAVGQSGNSAGTADVPLAERWNGTSWTIQHPPAPAWTAPPVLFNLTNDRVLGAVWNHPEVRPATFPIFADGSAAITGMRWARWTNAIAVTSSATYYDRSGRCCNGSDQHYYKVTVTLSGIRSQGGPEIGPYFSRMTISGPGFRPLTYTFHTFVVRGILSGAWT